MVRTLSPLEDIFILPAGASDIETRTQRAFTRSQSPNKQASVSETETLPSRPRQPQSQPPSNLPQQELPHKLPHVDWQRRTGRPRSPAKPSTPLKILKIDPEASIYRGPGEPIPTPKRVAVLGANSLEAVSKSTNPVPAADSTLESVYSPNVEWTDEEGKGLTELGVEVQGNDEDVEENDVDELQGEVVGDIDEVDESELFTSERGFDQDINYEADNDNEHSGWNVDIEASRGPWQTEFAEQAESNESPSHAVPQVRYHNPFVTEETEANRAEESDGQMAQEIRTRKSKEAFKKALDAERVKRAANSRRGVSSKLFLRPVTSHAASVASHGVATMSRGIDMPRSHINDDNGALTPAQTESLDKILATLIDKKKTFGARYISKKQTAAVGGARASRNRRTLATSQKSMSEFQPSVTPDPSHPGMTLGTVFSPIRLVYPAHPPGEHKNTWYARYVHQLYNKINDCAITHFGQRDITIVAGRAEGSYWVDAKTTPELENYVSMIAEPDPANGGWDRLLTEKTQRALLVSGIIAKVLEIKVFGALLFGADEGQLAFLEEFEKRFIDHEGYERTALRASTIRTLLSSNATPPHFHSSTLSLTHQIFALLLPFDLAQSRTQSPNTNIHAFAPDKCMQDLHDIVGHAAYLSVVIRLSSSVMFIRGDVPGEGYEEGRQGNVDHGLYLSSKAGVERILEERAVEKSNRGEIVAETESYVPRIKIAVWPSFQRFSPGNGRPGGERAGFRVYEVSNSRVLYYWGVKNRKNKGFVGFVEFMAKAKSKGGWLNRLSFGYLG